MVTIVVIIHLGGNLTHVLSGTQTKKTRTFRNQLQAQEVARMVFLDGDEDPWTFKLKFVPRPWDRDRDRGLRRGRRITRRQNMEKKERKDKKKDQKRWEDREREGETDDE
jgi:hypothetical protein